jgi:hypothetical protein
VKIHLKPTAAFKSRCGAGEHYIELDPADVYVTVELLDALGAVDKDEFDELVQKEVERRSAASQRVADEYRHRAEAAEANLAEAEATIERVNGATAIWGDGFRPAVLAALTPPKPFELPTEVPARIEAKQDGRTYVLDLWVDGDGGTLWFGRGCAPISASQVMADFTGHRLLDGEA